MRSRGALTPAGPQKWARCARSVIHANTSSRGASKTRLKCNSPCSATGAPPSLRVRLQIGQQHVELVEALVPHSPVRGDPVQRAIERAGLQVAGAELGVAPARDQAAALQHLEMLGDPRQRHGEGGGQLGHGGVALGQPAHDGAPGGVGQRGEGGVEGVGGLGRHAEYLTPRLVNCQVKYRPGSATVGAAGLILPPEDTRTRREERAVLVQVITGTTREGRFSERVAAWVVGRLEHHEAFDVELVDLRDHPLPFFDADPPARTGRDYADEAVTRFSRIIDRADGYVLLTAEYNHGYPAVLKNALDSTFVEWRGKPVAFVGGGESGRGRGHGE